MTRIIRVIAHMDYIIYDGDPEAGTNLAADVEDFLRNSNLMDSDAYLCFANLDVVQEDVTKNFDPKDIIPTLPPMTVDNREPIKGEPPLEITFHEPIPYFGHDPIDDHVNNLLYDYLTQTHSTHKSFKTLNHFELDWRDSMTVWVHARTPK